MLAVLLPGTSPAAADGGLLQRFRELSGGDGWERVEYIRSKGELSAGGLDGEVELLVDIHGGRTVERYRLGPVSGAQGYDGESGWTLDPGGEVMVQDAEEARRRAVSLAWLGGRGYWFPDRRPYQLDAPVPRAQEGDRFQILVARPHAGLPVELWFDAESGWLHETRIEHGVDTLVTTYSDWREVDGLMLPFRLVSDRLDASGQADPRSRSEIRLREVSLAEALDAAEFSRPQTAPQARIEASDGRTEVRFDLLNLHLFIDASIDGQPARLLVDTGGANLLTPTAAARLGLKPEGRLAARGVGEGSVDLGLARAAELRLGLARLERPLFYVVDLGDLPKVEGLEFDGLVGYEVFSRFGVVVDYAGRKLVLSEPDRFVPPPGASALPFELTDRMPVVRGELDGLPATFTVDTGSRASLTLHTPFVRQHDLLSRYAAAPETVVGWGVGGPSRARPARLGTLRLGGHALHGIAGDLHVGSKGAFASGEVSGNLGGGVLARFTLGFDYAQRTLYLAPNTDFHRPDPFDRSGLFLLGDGDALRIVDVAEDSAAQQAGLAAGERILAIDRAVTGTRSLSDWRDRLRLLPPGTVLQVEVAAADGTPRTVGVTLADRLPAAVPDGPSRTP